MQAGLGMGAEAQSFSSEAFHTADTSMQVAVSTEKFLQQEHSVKRYGISFCNTCAEMFLLKVSIILKKKVEMPTSDSKVR